MDATADPEQAHLEAARALALEVGAMDPSAPNELRAALFDGPLISAAVLLSRDDPAAMAALRDSVKRSRVVTVSSWDKEVKSAAKRAANSAAIAARGRLPVIAVEENVLSMSEGGHAALAARPGDVYWRRGELVRVVDYGDPTPAIEPLPLASLLAILSDVATWALVTQEGEQPVQPPIDAVRALHARGSWERLRRLDAVTDAPLLRRDGSVVQSPGYDAPSRTLYRPSAPWPHVPEAPIKRDAIAALEVLQEPLVDFCFLAPSDRSATLALILTAVGRSAVAGPCPLFLIRATTPGSGKGLLAGVVGTIAYGAPLSPSAAAVSREEERKALTTWCASATPAVLLDNVEGSIGSDVLAAALTSETWQDRLLGSNREVRGRVPLILATGNNVHVQGDLGRRVIPIDLDPGMERPEEREGFAHPQLLDYVARRRPALLVAALTVLRWFCAEGRPASDVAQIGSYEAWSDLVRGALVYLGLPDPAEGRHRLRETGDPQREADELALTVWRESLGGYQLTASELIRRAGQDEGLAEALAGLHDRLRADYLDPSLLGYALRRLSGRILGGHRLEAGDRTKRGRSWRVDLVD